MTRINNIDIITQPDRFARLKMRPRTKGAELELVSSFIERLASTQRHSARTVLFLEPHIDSGFPDLVRVDYSDTFMNAWSERRMLLEDDDLRIQAYLIHSRGASEQTISTSLGLNRRKVAKSLELLYTCEMVRGNTRCWKPVKRQQYFGIKRITAFEAKMSSAANVLHQALINTRFASSSYAIMATKTPTRATIERFTQAGIGLITGPEYSRTVQARETTLPSSYVTLKFNEWVGRMLFEGAL